MAGGWEMPALNRLGYFPANPCLIGRRVYHHISPSAIAVKFRQWGLNQQQYGFNWTIDYGVPFFFFKPGKLDTSQDQSPKLRLVLRIFRLAHLFEE